MLPDDKSGCEVVARAIRQALDRVLDSPCVDELNLDRPRIRGRPFYGMLRYAQQGMHGYVYIWLFPDESETKISYAILLYEQPASRERAGSKCRDIGVGPGVWQLSARDLADWSGTEATLFRQNVGRASLGSTPYFSKTQNTSKG